MVRTRRYYGFHKPVEKLDKDTRQCVGTFQCAIDAARSLEPPVDRHTLVRHIKADTVLRGFRWRFVEDRDVNEGEVWKEAEGCEGLRVSNYGRFWQKNGVKSWGTLKPMNAGRNFFVEVKYKGKSLMLHRLVAKAFVDNDNPWDKRYVIHINGDPHYNWATNLRWATRSEVSEHWANRRWEEKKGKTWEDVIAIAEGQ